MITGDRFGSNKGVMAGIYTYFVGKDKLFYKKGLQTLLVEKSRILPEMLSWLSYELFSQRVII